MRLRIESDGTPFGTKISDAHTGEYLENVVSVTFTTAAAEVSSVQIVVRAVEMDVTAEVAAGDRVELRPARKKYTPGGHSIEDLRNVQKLVYE